MENLLSKSEKIKPEYCCSVVRIGKLTPIEGSDFLAKTSVIGTQIVVRKDQVHEDDIMFYASNESALNTKFLSVNNLFEISSREMNSNAKEINSIMEEYERDYKKPATDLKNKAKNVKSSIDANTKNAKKLRGKIDKLKEELENEELTPDMVKSVNGEIEHLTIKLTENVKKALSKTTEYNNLKNEAATLVKKGQHIVDESKKMCGFFNKYGRVRCVKLKGEPSFGFVFSVGEMRKFCPEIDTINLANYIGEDFDTVKGELFVKAYVPPIKEYPNIKRGEKKDRSSQFDKIVAGEFKFHYDTAPLQKNIHLFNPTDIVTISLKIHGTSVCIGKLHVKDPIKLNIFQRVWNKIAKFLRLGESMRFTEYNVIYGPVYSSRKVIKNKYLNENVKQGFYETDVYSEWGDKMYPYLSEGMTIYGEIFGYEANEKYIQSYYDYGCEVGTNKLMIYRISTTLEDGSKYEWNVSEVQEWTNHIVRLMKERYDETYKQLHPIDILYHGMLIDLYPKLNVNLHWHENVLEEMEKDKEHFGMEENEPLCTANEVPREGVVIRKDNDPVLEAFKLKCLSFLGAEAIRIDAGEIDMEMFDGFVNEEENV